jgi:endonuclease/exonuclease/phosphatase family metal-dependent hydrolase
MSCSPLSVARFDVSASCSLAIALAALVGCLPQAGAPQSAVQPQPVEASASAPAFEASAPALEGSAALPSVQSNAAAIEPVAEGSTLVVGTWNLEWLNREDGGGPTPRQAEDYVRLAGYAERLGAHVVVLQEIDGPEAARRVFDPTRWQVHVAEQSERQRVGVAWRHGIDLTVLPDVESLNPGGLREGIDAVVRIPGTDATVRILGVHMKSGCFSEDYRTSTEQACVRLASQLPALEAWIDARAAAGEAFALVGDFNRNFLPGDPLWAELDDGDPAGLDLTLTHGENAPTCWGGRYPAFVDHVLLDARAAAFWTPGAWAEFPYLAEHDAHREQLSDHCPITVTLRAP